MHLRPPSEIFFDEPYRLPEILVGGGAAPGCALTAAGGGRTVASLTTRHLVAALEGRCVSALRDCLGDGELDVRPTLVRLDHVAPAPFHVLRLTAWVDHVEDGSVRFSARAHDGESGLCEVTIALAIVRARGATEPDWPARVRAAA
jgi:predicted thioesterase